MKQSVWDIQVVRRSRLRVCFEEGIDEAEAIEMFLEGSYDDIIDDEDVEILGVESAK